MLKILILEPDENLMELLRANLSSEFNAEVIACPTHQQVKSKLESEAEIDCLLLRGFLGSETLAMSVLAFMQSKNMNVKTMVLGNIDFEADFVRYLPEDIQIKDLLNEIIKEVEISEELLNSVSLPDYVGFRLHYFFQINKFESDVYLKIKKSDGDQYVKRILAGDEFDKKLLLKYKQSGLEELYIEKAYRHKFWDSLIGENLGRLRDLYQDSSKFDDDKIIELSNDSYVLSQDLLTSIGINEQTVKMTNASIKTMTETVKSMDKLGPMLKKLLANEASYAYKKCHLISLFSYEVLKKMDWFPNDKFEESLETMVFVSFMHDIVLQKEELLRIGNKINLYRSEASDREKELVKNHANIVSSMVQKFPRSPSGSDVIIKQHHGTTNGIGFAESYNSNLSKMAIVLIVLEKFVMRIMDFKSGQDSLKTIVDEFYEELTQPSYKKVLDALVSTILGEARASK